MPASMCGAEGCRDGRYRDCAGAARRSRGCIFPGSARTPGNRATGAMGPRSAGVFVATITESRRSLRTAPMIRSLLPSPYPAAVSIRLTPRSSARFSAATESASLWGPQLPPIAQPPKPISETSRPVPPNFRNFMNIRGIIRRRDAGSRNSLRKGLCTNPKPHVSAFLIDQKGLWSVFDILISHESPHYPRVCRCLTTSSRSCATRRTSTFAEMH